MSKKIIILLLITLTISLFGCNKNKSELIIEEDTQQISNTSETQSADVDAEKDSKPLIPISTSDTLQILVREDGAPGMFLGEDGEVHGFYVDLEKMIMKEMGQKYNFVPFSDVGPAAHGLKSGTYHIALAVPDLPDYRSFLNLSKSYEILHYVTFIQKGNTDVSGSTREELILSLHGKKVGVQTQGHIYQILREIKEIEMIEYPTTTKALEDLNKGLLDAVPDVKRIGLYYTEKNNWNIKPIGVPILSLKDTSGFSQMYENSLVERYNTALEALISNGEFDKLYASYFGPMSPEDKPE